MTTNGETLGRVGDQIVEQAIFLDRLLGRLIDRGVASGEHRGTLHAGVRTEVPRPTRDRSTNIRRIRMGGNETWHDEMNPKIGRMSRQLSFDSTTTSTLSK